jgi:uncharacterized protein DUF3551
MRNTLALLAIALLGVLAKPELAAAEVIYPWCAQYNTRGGARNCGFTTWEQCRATVSGIGGFCIENAFYQPGAGYRARNRDWHSPPGLVPTAPAEAVIPEPQTQWTVAARRTSWPPGWCSLKGRRGDPQLFLRQQAVGCF